jgi:hypothetical protein
LFFEKHEGKMRKNLLSFIGICTWLYISCASAGPVKTGEATGIPLDRALSDIAAYFAESLPANTRIALLNIQSEAPLLSDYILEELWIHFEDSKSFILVERQNLELIQKEIEYQYSGMVSDESSLSIGHQFGPQTLMYGAITPMGREYRLVIRTTDVEKSVTSIRTAAVMPDRRFTALLEKPPANKADGRAGISMANALYSGSGNPWQFTVSTDKSSGNYRDGDYMTLRIYAERDAWFKITHIDVNGNTQTIYPASPHDHNFIRAGETRQIPDNTQFRMGKPYGEEIILVGAYEKPFALQPRPAAALSDNLLVRGITVESADTYAEMRPAATAQFRYRIGP